MSNGPCDHFKVFNWGTRATSYSHTLHARKHCRIGEILGGFDLECARPVNLAESRQLFRVGTLASTNNDHQVNRSRRLQRVLLTTDRHRADGVDYLEFVAA